MEFLQFGFAAAFCVLLYADQRTTIKALTRAHDRLSVAIEKILLHCNEKKNT